MPITDGQLSLFGEHDFTSRKRYRAAEADEDEQDGADEIDESS